MHVKTNLNYDGRVLASIDAISQKYKESIIRVALLSDAPIKELAFSDNVIIDEIYIGLRKYSIKKIIKPLIIFIYIIKDFMGLIMFRPNIIHAHDNTAIFAPFLYKLLFGKKVVLVYDDHEIFNRPESIASRIMVAFEGVVSRCADLVVVANAPRGRIIKKIFGLSKQPFVLENFFYDRSEGSDSVKTDSHTLSQFKQIDCLKNEGFKLILHQGRIIPGRGKSILESVLDYLPEDWKLCIIGVSKDEFENSTLFSSEKVLFLGKVKFDFLPILYNKIDASIIFYKGDKLNNRYCAPNRLYQAMANSLPLIVNEDNPVLSSIVLKGGLGVAISESGVAHSLKRFFESYNSYREKYQSLENSFSPDQVLLLYQKVYAELESHLRQ